MSKKIYLFSLVLLALAFVSCDETKEEGKYDNWKARNEAFIDSLENVYATVPGKGGLERIELQTAPGNYIYYKNKSEDAVSNPNYEVPEIPGRPAATSTVTIYYKGTNILGEYFDGNFTGANPIVDTESSNKKKRDANIGDSTPATFELSGLIVGWQEALQCMEIGERWVIYIPAKYAYDSQDKSTIIPAYSTLIFDIQLLDADPILPPYKP